jgi:hypothetical protein
MSFRHVAICWDRSLTSPPDPTKGFLLFVIASKSIIIYLRDSVRVPSKDVLDGAHSSKSDLILTFSEYRIHCTSAVFYRTVKNKLFMDPKTKARIVRTHTIDLTMAEVDVDRFYDRLGKLHKHFIKHK